MKAIMRDKRGRMRRVFCNCNDHWERHKELLLERGLSITQAFEVINFPHHSENNRCEKCKLNAWIYKNKNDEPGRR